MVNFPKGRQSPMEGLGTGIEPVAALTNHASTCLVDRTPSFSTYLSLCGDDPPQGFV